MPKDINLERPARRPAAVAGPDEILEQHPDLGWMDRVLLNTFASSPDVIKAELIKRGFDAQKNTKTGAIRIKKPGEDKYHYFDPQTGIDLKDMPADIVESLYDIGKGVASTLAGSAAAVAATPATGGVLALPAASLASGATQAGLTGLQQGIGKMLGYENNINPSVIEREGIIGAAAPLVFGAGAKGAMLAKSLAAGIPEKEAATIAGETGRSILGYAADKSGGAMNSMSAYLAGIYPEALREFWKNKGGILALKDKYLRHDLEEGTRDIAKNAIKRERDTIGGNINKTYEEAGERGVTVPTSGATNVIDEEIAKAEQALLRNPGDPDAILNLKTLNALKEEKLKSHFYRDVVVPAEQPVGAPEGLLTENLFPSTTKRVKFTTEYPSEVSPTAAWEKARALEQSSKADLGSMRPVGSGGEVSDQLYSQGMYRSSGGLRGALKESVPEVAPFNRQYKILDKEISAIEPFVDDPLKFVGSIYDKGGSNQALYKRALKETLSPQEMSTFNGNMSQLQAYYGLVDPSLREVNKEALSNIARVAASGAGGNLPVQLAAKGAGAGMLQGSVPGIVGGLSSYVYRPTAAVREWPVKSLGSTLGLDMNLSQLGNVLYQTGSK